MFDNTEIRAPRSDTGASELTLPSADELDAMTSALRRLRFDGMSPEELLRWHQSLGELLDALDLSIAAQRRILEGHTT